MPFGITKSAAVWGCMVAMLAVPATQAFAQVGGGPMGGSMGRGGMGGPPGGMRDGGSPGERCSVSPSGDQLIANTMRQLDNVQYQLRLRPGQEVLWAAYQEKVGALLEDQLRPRRETVGGNALQQMDGKIDIVRNRLAALEDISGAARKLYQQLDTAQREMADRLLPATLPAGDPGLGAERPGNPGRPPEGAGGWGAPPMR